ncbi:MAG: hypothetical protein QM785_01360 [Pyrinomonadaceae bacterium]
MEIDDNKIRRFLLGEMPSEEHEAFEQQIVEGDAELFEAVRVVDDELTEEYLRGNLSAAEAKKFEAANTSQTRCERLDLHRAMLAEFDLNRPATQLPEVSPGFLAKLIAALQLPQLAVAAALLVAVIIGVWFLVLRKPQVDIVKQTETTPTELPSPIPTAPIDVNGNKPPAKTPTPTPANTDNRPPPEQHSIIAAVILSPGLVRSGGSNPTVKVGENTKSVNFTLPLRSTDYRNYRVEIEDGAGKIVYRSATIAPRGGRLNFSSPAKNLSPGDYIVRAYGVNNAGENESAADAQFNVNR